MNNKQKWLRVMLMLLLVSMTACNKEKENIDEIVQTTPRVTSAIFEADEFSESGNFKIKISSLQELKGKRAIFEKIDASEMAEYNAANRCRSRDVEENQQSLFCVTSDTGVVYFINQNKDWYIYQLKDGVSELAVELPARELYMWEGTLYFMIEDYDKYELAGINENDIFAYTPEDGTIRFVYAAKEFENAYDSHLGVDKNGLYLCCSKDGREVEVYGQKTNVIDFFYYRLPHNGNEVEEDPYRMAVPGWGDYYLNSITSILVPRNEEAGETIELGASGSKCCIIGDKFYSVSSGSILLSITDIPSGEIKSYDCKPVFKNLIGEDLEKPQVSWVQSFTVTRDYVWMVVRGKYLVRIEPESGEIQCFVMESRNCYIEKLYTDGGNVYALYRKDILSSMTDLVRIKTEKVLEVSEIYNVPMLAIEYLLEE